MLMPAKNGAHVQRCGHSAQEASGLLALITIADPSRADYRIADAVCDAVSKTALNGVCRFTVATRDASLEALLLSHQAAIIIDSTQNGTAPGTVSIIDLSALLKKATPIKIGATNGLFLADELRAANKNGHIPSRLVFFGVEIDDSEQQGASIEKFAEKVVCLARQLSPMITKMVETLKKHA